MISFKPCPDHPVCITVASLLMSAAAFFLFSLPILAADIHHFKVDPDILVAGENSEITITAFTKEEAVAFSNRDITLSVEMGVKTKVYDLKLEAGVATLDLDLDAPGSHILLVQDKGDATISSYEHIRIKRNLRVLRNSKQVLQ